MNLFDRNLDKWIRAQKEQEYERVIADIEMLIKTAQHQDETRAQNAHELARYLVNNGVYVIIDQNP